MSDTDLAIQLARLDERLIAISASLATAAETRKDQYQSIEKLALGLQSVDSRLKAVEKSISESEPTLQEFVKIKSEVLGAGKMGKVVWVMLGACVSTLFSLREQIAGIFKGHP